MPEVLIGAHVPVWPRGSERREVKVAGAHLRVRVRVRVRLRLRLRVRVRVRSGVRSRWLAPTSLATDRMS